MAHIERIHIHGRQVTIVYSNGSTRQWKNVRRIKRFINKAKYIGYTIEVFPLY